MKKPTQRIFISLRRAVLPAAAAAVLAAALAMAAFAELVPALDNYNVSFTTDKKMVSNFKTSDMYNQMSGMQPGDYTDIVMNLKNEYSESVDWYMTNKVLKSLEDTRENHEGLSGGAYTYILTFKNTSTGEERTLFSSDTVGGENVSAAGEGLHEATGALQDWLYLDTFSQGEGGVLTLRVALDGETQGNDYQDTLAELQMNFAVELNTDSDTPTPENVNQEEDEDDSPSSGSPRSTSMTSNRSTTRSAQIVQTGDYSSTIPYLVAAGVSGIGILVLAIYSLRERRRQSGGEA